MTVAVAGEVGARRVFTRTVCGVAAGDCAGAPTAACALGPRVTAGGPLPIPIGVARIVNGWPEGRKAVAYVVFYRRRPGQIP